MGDILEYSIFIDSYALIIMTTIFVVLLIKRSYITFNGRYVLRMVLIVECLLVLELISFLVHDHSGTIKRIINITSNSLLYILTPLAIALWGGFVEYRITKKRPTGMNQIIYYIPVVIVLGMILVNFFHPFVFQVDQNNVYSRLSGYGYILVILGIIYVYVITHIIYNYKKLKYYDTIVLLSFSTIPLLGGLIQILNEHLATIYPSMAIGIIILYVSFESIGNVRDQQTGFLTRKHMYGVFEQKFIDQEPFVTVLIDLDNLKIINDRLGHLYGDDVIREFSATLKEQFGKNSIYFRIGGDEFMLITKFSKEETKTLLDDILLSFWEDSDKPMPIQFSYGIVEHTSEMHRSLDKIIISADEQMYQMKAVHKNYKRRSTDRI